jgi:hypothetical protein
MRPSIKPVRIQTPPIERTEQVATPAIPAASTPCAYDAAAVCNTDQEVATVLKSYDAALAEANRRLGWLGQWITTINEKKKKKRH